MDHCDDLTSLADWLHDQLWGLAGEELRALQAPLARRLAPLGLSSAALLAELSDESLALAFQKGFLPADVFTALLVDRYGPYLARWLFRWGTESHLALDLIQQLYVAFLERGLTSFRPDENFRAYLRRSAYHLWVAKVVRARKQAPLDGCLETVAGGPDPAQEVLDRESAGRIDQALGELPPREQSVVRETMAGRSADEIAGLLNLPKSKVFMSLFRGRRRLEKLLQLPPRPGKAPRAASPSPRSGQEHSHV